MSTEPTWRVYLTEWLTVYTSDASGGLEGGAECLEHFRDKYRGRVWAEDHRVVPVAPMALQKEHYRPYCLQLRLPNLKGEFKDHGDALSLASELMDGYKDGLCDLVRRGSAEEKALLDYGKKMLPGAGTTEG